MPARLSELKRRLHKAYNETMRWITALLILLTAAPACAEDASAPAIAPISLAELAANADVVAVAQIKDTDYLLRREIPVSGSAYLKILIPYKMDQAADMVEVYEKGLRDQECYFPNPTVFEEGRRYLLFLARDVEYPERLRGLPEGCALEVLVDSDNGYALRYPVTGINLSDPLAGLAQPMTFSDGYAVVDDEDLQPARRDAMLDAGQIRQYQPGQWIYTTGIGLARVRELMGPDALFD